MNFPCVEIDLTKIRENVSKVLADCTEKGIAVAGVTKLLSGDKKVISTIVDAGITEIGDSRVKNFQKIEDLNVSKLLIRIPMMSEIENLVRYCDSTLISELVTAKEISKEAKKQGKIINLIVMHDLGDLREGYFDREELINVIGEMISLPCVKVVGIGTNWACYGGIKPTIEMLKQLFDIKCYIEKKYDIDLSVVSSGSSNCLHLLDEASEYITHLRVGSAILIGTGLNDIKLDGYNHDTFKLKAQIIELKTKPSLPIGEKCLNAFGKEVEFEDVGDIRRAIIAIGRQDVDIEEIIPDDTNIKVLGSSSDHIVLQVPDCYNVGDIIEFEVTYPGCLKIMTSSYVTKYYKE